MLRTLSPRFNKRSRLGSGRCRIELVSGEIVSIDPAKKVVAVKHKNRNGKDVTVVAVVDDHTKIREGKTDKSFADLRVGEHVQINYERQDKRDLAHEVLVENNSH